MTCRAYNVTEIRLRQLCTAPELRQAGNASCLFVCALDENAWPAPFDHNSVAMLTRSGARAQAAGAPNRALRSLAVACLLPAVWVLATQIADVRTRYSILTSAAVSVAGFFAALKLIPLTKAYTLRAGLSGLDINKKGSKEGEKPVPESLGLASGVVFLVRRRGA